MSKQFSSFSNQIDKVKKLNIQTAHDSAKYRNILNMQIPKNKPVKKISNEVKVKKEAKVAKQNPKGLHRKREEINENSLNQEHSIGSWQEEIEKKEVLNEDDHNELFGLKNSSGEKSNMSDSIKFEDALDGSAEMPEIPDYDQLYEQQKHETIPIEYSYKEPE